MNNEIIVTVVITSYNYGGYIRDALDGVLSQRVNFNYEILINDDASTDNSVAILKEYQSKYPDKFNVIYQKENQYSKGIRPWFNILFPLAQGKYIALCEGDDYWTDPLKLQKQVDFLEANEEYVMCGARAKCLLMSENSSEFSGGFLGNTKKVLQTEDFVKGYPMHTSTALFRASNLNLPEWMTKVTNGDVTLFALLSEYGPTYYMNEVVSVYRVTGSGAWSGASLEDRYYAFKNTVNRLNQHFNGRYKKQQYQWEYNEAKKVARFFFDDAAYFKYAAFILKNYHRYIWWFIVGPELKKGKTRITQYIKNVWIKFRMFVGLRTRLRRLSDYFKSK